MQRIFREESKFFIFNSLEMVGCGMKFADTHNKIRVRIVSAMKETMYSRQCIPGIVANRQEENIEG